VTVIGTARVNTSRRMTGRALPADVKRTSALRRVAALSEIRLQSKRGGEGDVCAFELPRDASAITVESPTGRMMEIAPGDFFLATPGHRESTRWASGRIPAGGLVPGQDYWVVAESGIVGELVGDPPPEEDRLGRVRYVGAVCGERGKTLNIRQFAGMAPAASDRDAPVYLVLGTSGNAGKTTAAVAVLRALRMKGHTVVIALKATGTPAVAEIERYRDFGAAQAFDCIDFGLPTTYPSGREDIRDIFGHALDFCLSLSAEALVVECGGDLFGASVPEFLACLKARRADPKIILAAADTLGALGSKHVLAEVGLGISLITGPCTDTTSLRERTEALCGVPARNLLRSLDQQSVL
jgi:hypothetical protein